MPLRSPAVPCRSRPAFAALALVLSAVALLGCTQGSQTSSDGGAAPTTAAASGAASTTIAPPSTTPPATAPPTPEQVALGKAAMHDQVDHYLLGSGASGEQVDCIVDTFIADSGPTPPTVATSKAFDAAKRACGLVLPPSGG